MAGAAHVAVLLLSIITLFSVGDARMWELDNLDDLDEPSRRTYSQKRLLGCKYENDNCHGYPGCCGDLACFWADGYSPFRPGTCVMCIEKGLACQRNSGCCEGMFCDKDDLLDVNGVCHTPRTRGACYSDTQCLYDCEKPYYKAQGHCTSAPSTPSG